MEVHRLTFNLSVAPDQDLHVWDGIAVYWKVLKQWTLKSDFVSRL